MQAVTPVTALNPAEVSTTGSSASQSVAAAAAQQAARQRQAAEFAQIKRELDLYAAKHGFGSQVQTTIEAAWSSGCWPTTTSCSPPGRRRSKAAPVACSARSASLLNIDETHPIDVEGNTTNVPIHSSLYPSNWELSTARASTVVRFLVEHGVAPSRLTASGNADQRPVASDATAAGRARNRRVEIVMRRIYSGESENEGEP